jgi:CRP-like cAMP-binding protein
MCLQEVTMPGNDARPVPTMMPQDNATFLQQVPLFRGLDPARLASLASQLAERHYARDAVLLWQGSPVADFLIIKNGLVQITRMAPLAEDAQVLAYLRPGDILGDLDLLAAQRRGATATATALTAVAVLALPAAVGLALLQEQGSVALELARLLATRLRATNERISNNGIDPRLGLVVGVGSIAPTLLGTALAMALAAATQEPTVYTEYPDPQQLLTRWGIAPDTAQYTHPAGFDVVLPPAMPDVPPLVAASMTLDRLTSHYPNIVIGLAGALDAQAAYLLDRADQVIIVTPPDQEAAYHALNAQLRALIEPEKTTLYTVVLQAAGESQAPMPPHADFILPPLDALPPPPEQTLATLPPDLAALATTLADRLARTASVSVYIPTTLDVDQAVDTTLYVERTLRFLGDRFGGATATTEDAQGVWKSDQLGLVGETVHIVRTYVTQPALQQHLPGVVEYMEQLKVELRQEAMALEVNQRLILI